jgi:hypothetical protein
MQPDDPQDRPGEDAPAVDPTSAAEIGSAYGTAAAKASPATGDEDDDGATIAMEGATAAVPADTEDPPLPREGVSEPVTPD